MHGKTESCYWVWFTRAVICKAFSSSLNLHNGKTEKLFQMHHFEVEASEFLHSSGLGKGVHQGETQRFHREVIGHPPALVLQ